MLILLKLHVHAYIKVLYIALYCILKVYCVKLYCANLSHISMQMFTLYNFYVTSYVKQTMCMCVYDNVCVAF